MKLFLQKMQNFRGLEAPPPDPQNSPPPIANFWLRAWSQHISHSLKYFNKRFQKIWFLNIVFL